MRSSFFLKKNIQQFKQLFLHFVVFSLLFFRPARIFAQIRNWDDLDGSGANDPSDPKDTCLVDGVPTIKCAEVVAANILFISNVLILLVLFIMFVIGSYKWMLSFGNPEKIEEAKKTFMWAIIGLLVYLSAYVILFTIDQLFLGGKGDVFRLQIGD